MEAYDADVQMFIESPRELDYDKLAFLRWLYENTDTYQEDSNEHVN